MKRDSLAVWWIRRDLRLADNPALTMALARSQRILPLFILDPALLDSPSHRRAHKRLSFLFDGLRILDSDLRARGSRLIVRQGHPAQVKCLPTCWPRPMSRVSSPPKISALMPGNAMRSLRAASRSR